MKAFFQTSDSKNIYYESHGEGPVLVLIPGFLCTAQFFDKNLGDLSAVCRVIIPDPRGFGNSSKSGEGMNLRRMAQDIRELLDHLDVTDAVLLGWSMGGNIAAMYYEMFGAYRIRRIGFLDSTLFPYGDGAHNAHNLAGYNLDRFAAQMKRAYSDYRGYCEDFARSLFKNPVSEEVLSWVTEEAMKCPVNCAMALYEDFIHTDCEKVLPEITIPVLLCAAASPRTPKGPEMADYYRTCVTSGCTFHLFEEGGHIFFYECPEEFLQVVLEFMKEKEVDTH